MHQFVPREIHCTNPGCYAQRRFSSNQAARCPLGCEKALALRQGEEPTEPPPLASAVRQELRQAFLLAGQGDGRVLDELLCRWHDSVEECCRRGLDAQGVIRLAATYQGIEEVERSSARVFEGIGAPGYFVG